MIVARKLFLTVVAILLFAALPTIAAPPATQPTTKPTTRPAGRPGAPPAPTAEQRKMMKLEELTKKSIELAEARKYVEAEKAIAEALEIDPEDSTSIYNMACVKAICDDPDIAMNYLEKSAELGFEDFLHIQHDPDLDSLRTLPRYLAMVAAKETYQKNAADQAIAKFKKQLGEKYIYQVDPVAKLIFAANTDSQTLAAVKSWLSAQARSQWRQLFEHHPDQYIAIVLPSEADYRKMVRMPGVQGLYMHDSHMLIARTLGQVMTHEFTHAIHAGDLDALDQQHPIWITEGLASLFESAQFEGDTLIPRDNFRLSIIQAAQRRNKLIPLEKLFALKQPEFMANPMLGYGQSSSILLYLYEKNLLRPFYDQYKQDYHKDSSGKTTLQNITGQKLADFEAAWQKWMMTRKPPAMDTGRDGVFIGIRYDQANDGLKILEVVPKAPGDQAGMKPGDVIVAVNGGDMRDTLSFVPLLKTFKPGDQVIFKVRRASEYLDLKATLIRRPEPPKPAKATTRPSTQPAAKLRATSQPATEEPRTK
jgi:tetratricopeptide (TPR) repeat protein